MENIIMDAATRNRVSVQKVGTLSDAAEKLKEALAKNSAGLDMDTLSPDEREAVLLLVVKREARIKTFGNGKRVAKDYNPIMNM
jgi:hypothetical protein